MILALCSGAPALVYEVVWTREVALLAGSQIEALSAVLVAYFGGLALGALWLGPLADRARRPLALYGALEIGAALLALGAGCVAWGFREHGVGGVSEAALIALGAAGIAPATFLLGGTLPALVRSADADVRTSARTAGFVVGANTAGAVGGVGIAALGIPRLGLRATLVAAAAASLAIGAAALVLSRSKGPPATPRPRTRAEPIGAGVLVAAALAGAATLAYEVLVARAASLRLGSSLLAWAWVLALFLLGLALGNALLARRAARSADPARDLGLVETLAAIALALGFAVLLPAFDRQARGLTLDSLARVVLAALGPALLMGGAFPLLVRLAARGPGGVAGCFARVVAVNTAGGIAGALIAPFALLPAFGLAGAGLVCAAANGVLGVSFLAVGGRAGRWRAPTAAALVLVAAVPVLAPRAPADPRRRVLYVDSGPQATAVVTREGPARYLVVDGDPEASTFGRARRTEELLAALPLLLHPDARALLEVGLGSGISLGTATRFPLERIHCVEIADSVLRAARFFAPDNAGVAEGADLRVRIDRGDGRLALAHRRESYDVVVANTVHPWSLGATGLYSREYFARVAAALRPGGIAAQWIPLERIAAASLERILRTFFAVFPEGALFWGDENLIALGGASADRAALARGFERSAPAREVLRRAGIPDAAELARRRIARAAAVRSALGPGSTLEDDRPVLELESALWRGGPQGQAAVEDLLVRLARAGATADPEALDFLLWARSRQARAEGDQARADPLEALAIRGGLVLAARARAEREIRAGYAELAAGRTNEAEALWHRALGSHPEARDARFGLAVAALGRGELDTARAQLHRLLAARPEDAESWNLLGAIERRAGDRAAARRAFEAALRADPFYPEPARALEELLRDAD